MFRSPPRDGLVRARPQGFEVRSSEDGMPTLHGYALRFNEWTRISSAYEGTFMERISPGAAKKTLAESADNVKILFNHGHDPNIGEKTLAAPTLTEDRAGVAYSGQLFDTSYNRDLLPGLEAGQYGASFKFRVVKESIVENPERSEFNPDGIPERSVEELELFECGPVTFPAYAGASAGVRSLTDEYVLHGNLEAIVSEWVVRNTDRVRAMLDAANTDLAESVDSDTTTEKHSEQEPDHSEVTEPDHSGRSRETKDVPLYGTQPAQSDSKPDWHL